MSGTLRALYLVPTGATALLADEPCGGRVPQVYADGDDWHPASDSFRATTHPDHAFALALVHDGRVVPLAWWRAAQTAFPSQPCPPPLGMLALDLAEEGAAMGHWRVVRVTE